MIIRIRERETIIGNNNESTDKGLQVCGHRVEEERPNDSSGRELCAEMGSFFFIYESGSGEAWVNIDSSLCLKCDH